MSSSDDYTIAILNYIVLYVNRFVILPLYILANIGNFLSVLIFLKRSWRKNVCILYFNVYLLFNTCYINSSMISGIFIFGFKINILNRSVILCKLYFYTVFLFSTLSPTILILASIDRLLISSQNIDTRLYSSKRLAYFSVGTSTIFWSIFYIHLLIKVNIQQFNPTYYDCNYDLFESYPQFVTYFTLIVNTLYCLIIIILSIFSFKNVRHIHVFPRHQRRDLRSMTKKDFQLLRCLFAFDIIYIVFSISLVVYMAYSVTIANTIQTSLERAINNFFGDCSHFLHHIPYSTSFFIFILVSKAYRHELKRMVFKLFRKNLPVMQTKENPQHHIISVVESVALPS
ncbi:hypothetical protein I4U23_020161 [Adineta vaga]|nr:hypothetical protein I4U23_020161 [Adineta vaga]